MIKIEIVMNIIILAMRNWFGNKEYEEERLTLFLNLHMNSNFEDKILIKREECKFLDKNL